MMAVTNAVSSEDVPGRAVLAKGLLILRITLGLFLLQWGLEKFLIPDVTTRIFGHFYKIDLALNLTPVIGAAECAVAIAILLGLYKRYSYLAGFLIHLVSVSSSWKQLMDPYGLLWGDVSHLFAAGVPVLAAFWLIYRVRDLDIHSLDDRIRRSKG